MLELDPIKARLATADPKDWRTYNAQCQALFVTHQRQDMFALVAEVERLRAAIARHRVEYLGGSIPARDRELWEVLHA